MNLVSKYTIFWVERSFFPDFRARDVRWVCHTQTFDARQGLARLMNVQQTDFGRRALGSLLARSLTAVQDG